MSCFWSFWFLVFEFSSSISPLSRNGRKRGGKNKKRKKVGFPLVFFPFLWELRLLGLDVSVRMRRVFAHVRWDGIVGMFCFF